MAPCDFDVSARHDCRCRDCRDCRDCREMRTEFESLKERVVALERVVVAKPPKPSARPGSLTVTSITAIESHFGGIEVVDAKFFNEHCIVGRLSEPFVEGHTVPQSFKITRKIVAISEAYGEPGRAPISQSATPASLRDVLWPRSWSRQRGGASPSAPSAPMFADSDGED